MKRIIIDSVVNGYTILVTENGLDREEYIARSWREVLDILIEVGAPDFQNISRKETESDE